MRERCDACDRGPLEVLEVLEGLCLSCWAARARVWEKIAREMAEDEGVECPEPEDAF